MTILLPALTVACGAFFVWLTVFVINRREYWATWRRVLVRSFIRTFPWGTTLAVVVVGMLWFVIGPRYRACAVVKIRGYPMTSLSFFPTSADDDYRATVVKRLQSPIVIRQAIESGGLQQLAELQSQSAAKDPGHWISRNLVVTRFGKGDGIYEVSFTARDPEIACKVVYAVLNSTMSQLLEGESERGFAVEELDKTLVRLGEEIELRRDRLSGLTRRADSSTIVEETTPREAASRRVSVELWEKLATAEVELSIGRARIAGLREAIRSGGDSQREAALQFAEDDVANLTNTVESLRAKLAAERSKHGDPPEPSLELDLARLELQSVEDIRHRISDCVVRWTTEHHGPPEVMILRDARTPKFPEELTPGPQTAFAGTAAFFTPFLLDVLWTAICQVRSARRRREAGG
jgi:hypothetical protein